MSTLISEDWLAPPPSQPFEGAGFARMIEALRSLQNHIAAARPGPMLVEDATAQFERLAADFGAAGVPEHQRVFGRRNDLPGRGQALVPPVRIETADAQQVNARVTFGALYLGSGGAVHGGAIPLLFDEVMGKLSSVGGRTHARTAYLHVNYRALTPVGQELHVSARMQREEGRKRYLIATLHHGETLLADAEGLFVGARA